MEAMPDYFETLGFEVGSSYSVAIQQARGLVRFRLSHIVTLLALLFSRCFKTQTRIQETNAGIAPGSTSPQATQGTGQVARSSLQCYKGLSSPFGSSSSGCTLVKTNG